MRLILCPLKIEFKAMQEALHEWGVAYDKLQIQGRWYLQVPQWQARITIGGHGKAQFAVTSQYWLSEFAETKELITIGGAGALCENLKVGEILAVTEVWEHDFKPLATQAKAPLYKTQTSEFLVNKELNKKSSVIHQGRIASGDEDIVTRKRAIELFNQTQSLAVAWESAGGIRTAAFNQLNYYEFRVITDFCDENTTQDFKANIKSGLIDLAEILNQIL